MRARARRGAAVGERVGSELRAVVAADELGRTATVDDRLLERGHGVVGVDEVVHDDGEGLAGVLVDDVEQLYGTAVHGLVELEVERPDMVRSGRGAPLGRDRRLTQTTALPTLRRHAQALLAPQTVDLLDVARMPGPGRLHVRTPVAPARTLAGELPQPRAQLPVRISIHRPVAL